MPNIRVKDVDALKVVLGWARGKVNDPGFTELYSHMLSIADSARVEAPSLLRERNDRYYLRFRYKAPPSREELHYLGQCIANMVFWADCPKYKWSDIFEEVHSGRNFDPREFLREEPPKQEVYDKTKDKERCW